MKKNIFFILILAILVCGGFFLQHFLPMRQHQPDPQVYQRILAITPSIEEVVFALAEPEQILATTDYNRHSLKSETRKVATKIKNTLPERPGTEAIIALRPEIVFLPSLFGKEQADTLKDCGFKVVRLETPNSYGEVKQRIRLVAKALHKESAGENLCKNMDQRVAAVQKKLSDIKTPKVAIAFGEAGAFGRRHGSFDNICSEAKVINGAGLLNLKKGEHLSKEQIISLNPDVIVCSLSSERSDMYQRVLNDPAFKNLKAIKNKQIVILDERYLNSTTQYFVDAVEQVAQKVYPEYFPRQAAYSVTGYDGVQVNLPGKPQRLMCFSYTFDVLTLGIVPPSRMVAVNNYADNPGLSSAYKEAAQVPVRFVTSGPVPMETILKLKPDLLIASDWTRPEQIISCRELGIPVLVCKGPTTIQEVRDTIRLIAQGTGEEAAGENLLAQMDAQLQKIETTLARQTGPKPVAMLVSQMTSYGGPGSMYDTLCEKARLTNGIGKVGIKNGQLLTKELVVKADPDFFLVAAPWKGDAYNYEKFKEEFLQDPSLKNLRGIRNIKVLPNRYLYSASPNCVFAIKALANVGYGAIFDLSGEHFLKGY